MNLEILSYDSIDSTNDFLKRNWKRLNNLTVCWALTQTKGRGRNARNWFSPEGGLWFSILFKPRKVFSDINLYTKISSVGLCRFFENMNLEAIIKWPNDIYINKKKIAGILTEIVGNESSTAIIVGIGININNDIPSELSNKAISLRQITHRKYKLHRLLKRILGHIIRIYNLRSKQTGVATIVKMWKRRLFPKEGMKIRVLINDKEFVVRVLNILEDHIEVLNEETEKILKVRSGEIIFDSLESLR